ncbi:Hpt domain-containing protein [Mucisphaera calidilacus]|uniref:Hpt domain protein n=1 Tax=Mucisphaera calidilacus TaxID=2527982 RepID=A0A518C1B3_9BACT|nr:Hpt domain-containing protein [Mucisphaera calidilacus]QDU73009.1 Hpt domain protein [Mucisphaera calidilacus]
MSQVPEPLLSEFADDPDMRELVEMFVEELPGRVSSIEAALAEGLLEDLARLSHQLKGAAGGYGFMPITDAAREVEALAKSGAELDALRGEVDALLGLCRRAQA